MGQTGHNRNYDCGKQVAQALQQMQQQQEQLWQQMQGQRDEAAGQQLQDALSEIAGLKEDKQVWSAPMACSDGALAVL